MPDGLGSASWLVEKMGKASTAQVVGIVEGFDEVLNNTSLLLLVTVGKRTLLLAGDAQVENWSWSLDRALAPKKPDVALRAALAGVEVYKVGHHGSRNATPKRLHQLWQDGPRRGPLVSVMSTRSGVYGESKATAVPQDKLVTGLKGVGSLRSTEELPKGAGWFDIEARAKPVNAEYSYTEGPVLD
jgi:hypothetical protein